MSLLSRLSTLAIYNYKGNTLCFYTHLHVYLHDFYLQYRRAALSRWKQKNGSNATYANLIRVFEIAGYRDMADNVRQIISSGLWYY